MCMMTIRDIVKLCGGAEAVASSIASSMGRAEKRFTSNAVYKWYSNGIPERHWSVIRRMSGVQAEQIHAANQALLQRCQKPGKAA